jgi:hypothetical protein
MRIHYEDAGGVFAFLVILAIVLGYIAFTLAELSVPGRPGVQVAVFGALLLAGWVPVEVAAARFLRRRRRLRAAG